MGIWVYISILLFSIFWCYFVLQMCLVNGLQCIHFISKLLGFTCTILIHILKHKFCQHLTSISISILPPNKARNLECIFLPLFPLCHTLPILPSHSLLALISSPTDLLVYLLISCYISLLVFEFIVFLSIMYLLLVISQRICDISLQSAWMCWKCLCFTLSWSLSIDH